MRPWPSSGPMGGSEAPDSISFNWGKVTATDRITGHQYPKSPHTPPSDFLFFLFTVRSGTSCWNSLIHLSDTLEFQMFYGTFYKCGPYHCTFYISGTRAVLLAVSNQNPNEWWPNIQPPLAFRKHSYLCFSSTQQLSRTNCCLGTKKEHFN